MEDCIFINCLSERYSDKMIKTRQFTMRTVSVYWFAYNFCIFWRNLKHFGAHYGVEAVVGGSPANINDYRYKVSLQSLSNAQHVCSGSIVHSEWIITSALCVAAAPPWDLVVAVGAEDALHPAVLHYGLSTHFPDLTDVQNNDIALVKLTEPIDLSDGTAEVVELPETATPHNTVATVAGWGSTQMGSSNSQLYELSQLVVGSWMCSIALDEYVPDGQLCATNLHGTGLCQGDEGSALVAAGALLGVASRRLGCGDAPDLYTRVHTHADWIRNTIDTS